MLYVPPVSFFLMLHRSSLDVIMTRMTARMITKHVRFEVFTVIIMKNIVFWDVWVWFERTFWRNQSAVTCLPVISCYSPALKMEARRFSETSVQTRPTRCYIPEDDILRYKTYLKTGTQRFFFCVVVCVCVCVCVVTCVGFSVRRCVCVCVCVCVWMYEWVSA
jgi:hypothetical protein